MEEPCGRDHVAVVVLGEHVSEEGNVGASSVVLEGDLVGLLCSDKWSGIPNSFSATPFPADSHSDYRSRLLMRLYEN